MIDVLRSHGLGRGKSLGPIQTFLRWGGSYCGSNADAMTKTPELFGLGGISLVVLLSSRADAALEVTIGSPTRGANPKTPEGRR